jgi:hypothetical protein
MNLTDREELLLFVLALAIALIVAMDMGWIK